VTQTRRGSKGHSASLNAVAKETIEAVYVVQRNIVTHSRKKFLKWKHNNAFCVLFSYMSLPTIQ